MNSPQMLIVGHHEYIHPPNLNSIICTNSKNQSDVICSIRKATDAVHGGLAEVADQDEQLLQYNEPDFHRLSLHMAVQKMLWVNQALQLVSEIKAGSKETKNGPTQKTLANLEYLLLRIQGILSTVVFHRTWQTIHDELLSLQHSNNSHFGGDKSFSEYASGKRPPSTTWPWSIKPSLAILWGVCWMFAMAIYPHQLSGWAMNPVKDEYAYSGTASTQQSPNPQQSLMAGAATHTSHHSNNGGAVLSLSSSSRRNAMSWSGGIDGVSLSNQIGGPTAETGAAALPAPGGRGGPTAGAALASHHVLMSSSGSAGHSQLPLQHGHAGSSKNTMPVLPPHPSGHIAVSPQAASLSIHRHPHLPIAAPSLSSASVSSNTHLTPVSAWPTHNLATSNQGLGIKHQSPGSSPYRPYNVLPTRTPSTCSPSQPLFAATGTGSQPNVYRDPTTAPSTPGYLNRSSFDGSLPNTIQPDYTRHQQAIISGSERSFDISTLSYTSSPALTAAHMDSITADAVLAARTVADLSNAATNGQHVDDSMDDTMDGFSSRRGHTHKRSEEPPKDEQGKMICRFQNTCPGVTFERKCEWSKHMDKHERPYKCEAPGCEKLQGFTYSGGLLRHQREVHKMHGGTKEPLHCPFENCKRAGGQGFTRKENLQEHIRRVHRRNTEGAELLAGAKRDLETLEMTDPLLRSELGGHDDMVDDVGAENIDPSVSSITGTPNPAKRRRLHVNGTPVDGSFDDTDFRALAKRLQDQNSVLIKANEQLRREVATLSERMGKVESYIGRRAMDEMNPDGEQV